MKWLKTLLGILIVIFLASHTHGRIVCKESISQDATVVFSIFKPSEMILPSDGNVKLEDLRRAMIDFVAHELKTDTQKVEMVLNEISKFGWDRVYKNVDGVDCALYLDEYNNDIVVCVKAKDTKAYIAVQEQNINDFVGKLTEELPDSMKVSTNTVELNFGESLLNTSVLLKGRVLISILQYKDTFIYAFDERPIQKIVNAIKNPDTRFVQQAWVLGIEESGLGDFGQVSLYYPQQKQSAFGQYYKSWCHNLSFSEKDKLEIHSFGRTAVSKELRDLVKKLKAPTKLDVERYKTTDTQMQLCVSGIEISEIYRVIKQNREKMPKVDGLVRFFDALEKSVAVNLRDFLDVSLSEEYSFLVSSGDDVLSSSYAMIATIKDEALLKMLTVRIEKKIEEALHRYSTTKMGGVHLEVKTREEDGVTISYMPIPNKSMLLPSYSCFDGKALVASSPDIIRAIYNNRNNEDSRKLPDLTGHLYFYGKNSNISSLPLFNHSTIEGLLMKILLGIYRESATILSCQESIDALVAISVLNY